MPDKSLNLAHGPALGTPARDRLYGRNGGIERQLCARYWRQHRDIGDHNARGLLEGGPDEFTGTLEAYIKSSMIGTARESRRAALDRQKLARVNARRKEAARQDFIRSIYGNDYVPRIR